MPQPAILHTTAVRSVPFACAAAVFLLAGGMLSVWLFFPEAALYSVTGKMKPNASLCLTLTSVALACFALGGARPRLVGRLLAAGVAALTTVTLSEYLFGFDFGLDQMLRQDVYSEESSAFPGRMAPNAASGLLFLSLGLLFLDRAPRWTRATASAFFGVTLLIGGVAIIGYLYQASALYQISSYLRISEYTSASLILLSLGAFFSKPELPLTSRFLSSGPQGLLLRRTLPAAVVIPIALCWLFMELRAIEAMNRTTGYSLLAAALVLTLGLIVWIASTSLDRLETARRQAIRQEAETLSIINQVGQSLVAELDLEKLVQSVTDAATRLSGAQFGAFFYNVTDEQGRTYVLNTISGVPREAFAGFPMPRNTEIFHPTFMGEGVVRSDDITRDPRYGKSAPYHGMPPGHLPVRSYLAVPVISRNGEVVGGLFFGHGKAGIFTEQAEKIVEGLAAQASVAMDNAKLYKEVQNSVRTRDQFLSLASHELRTPLTSLLLQVQLRERQLEKGDASRFTPEKIKKGLADESRQLLRISKLIDDMLDISRLSLGKLVIRKEPVDLSELVEEVIERNRPLFESSSNQVIFHGSGPVRGEWDRLRLEQVITNLFTNAMRYGNGKPVQIRVDEQDGHARLVVRDQGMGIDPRNHARIFERFERAIDANSVSGLGLGLYISRQIVEQHGGSISVESALGEGSAFTVLLPKQSAT